jgi:hypothetical protein
LWCIEKVLLERRSMASLWFSLNANTYATNDPETLESNGNQQNGRGLSTVGFNEGLKVVCGSVSKYLCQVGYAL